MSMLRSYELIFPDSGQVRNFYNGTAKRTSVLSEMRGTTGSG